MQMAHLRLQNLKDRRKTKGGKAMADKTKFYKTKDFTKEELAYYKGDGKSVLGGKEYAEIDKDGGDENEIRIRNRAMMDLGFKQPRRTPKDFKNNSEYALYDCTLYSAVNAIENGLGASILGG